MESKRAVLYARISVSHEESVSVARQLEEGRQFGVSRGWEIVGEFVDEGVSASHNRPDERAGWRQLLAEPTPYDVVIVWKLDRLARRVLDFHLANRSLEERGAAVVATDNSIDMTHPHGRLMAGILATFAEYEAEAIRARVKAARRHLIQAGRVVGGKVPYGWQSIPNPDGAGRVLAQDPERIVWVRGMAERVLRGDSVYSVMKWLDSEGAPTPTGRGAWAYSTVERILRHPVLAGMTPFNPGNDSKVRGAEVLRGPDGLPVVDESVAIMPVGEWRALVKGLDDRDSAQSRPRAMKAKTSGLLSGLVVCGDPRHTEPVRMWRGTTQGRESYSCPECHQAISNIESFVLEQFHAAAGDHMRLCRVVEVEEGEAALLPEIEYRLAELAEQLRTTDDEAEEDRLTEQLRALKRRRREARAAAPEVVLRDVREVRTYAEDWAAAECVEERRAVLDDALVSVTVRRGRRGGQGLDTTRLSFQWHHLVGVPGNPDPVEAYGLPE